MSLMNPRLSNSDPDENVHCLRYSLLLIYALRLQNRVSGYGGPAVHLASILIAFPEGERSPKMVLANKYPDGLCA